VKLYKIKDWESLFETCETKKRSFLRWVPTPNKHDGLSYRKMCKEKDKEKLFCYWNLLLQIASKTMPKDRRGYLERDGMALSAADMADVAGFAADGFERALEFFSSNAIGWLEVTYDNSAADLADNAANAARDAASPARKKEGIEENRMENENKEAINIIYAFDTDSFKKIWNDFIEMRKRIKKPIKTIEAQNRSMKYLSKNYTEYESIKMLEECTMREWLWIVEPKDRINNQYEKKQNQSTGNAVNNPAMLFMK